MDRKDKYSCQNPWNAWMENAGLIGYTKRNTRRTIMEWPDDFDQYDAFLHTDGQDETSLYVKGQYIEWVRTKFYFIKGTPAGYLKIPFGGGSLEWATSFLNEFTHKQRNSGNITIKNYTLEKPNET
jgi:hypothetical protein